MHALYGMTHAYSPQERCPNIVFIGVPDTKSLYKALHKLKANQIPQYRWPAQWMEFSEGEAEYNQELTAIATIPISDSIRQVLKNYRVLRFAGSGSLLSVVLDDRPCTNSPGLGITASLE